ncbi:MAG TPA: hypothetical protein VL123_05120 [Candidatus Udaeobacter sp.]|jgi:hypothetical protein|nr:hypothetical protein [Candidatus Udaeobacter sp.]
MKRKALLLLFTALVAFAVPVHAQTYELLFAFTGFDYQDPNSVPGPNPDPGYLAVGEGYKVVGFVTQFGPLLTPWVDTDTYEYTNHIFNLTVVNHVFFGGFLEADFGPHGRGRYYRDALSGGTPGTYGTFPPNATSPSTFIDGSMRVGGDINNFVLTYDFNSNQGNFNGDMNLDEGPDLIYIPTGQRSGWTLGGLAGRPNNTIPAGYDNQVTGECKILSTPVTHKTWGAVKALYR